MVNCYQAFVGVSGVISGLLGYGFYQIPNGRLRNWQYLFLMIAAISILMGIVVGIVLPDSPPKAKCFSETDRKLMVERVRGNDQGIKNPKWNWDQFREAVSDQFLYILFSLTFLKWVIPEITLALSLVDVSSALSATVVGGLGAFSNLLVNKAFGFNVLQSQLLGMPTGTLVIIIYAITATIVTKTHQVRLLSPPAFRTSQLVALDPILISEIPR